MDTFRNWMFILQRITGVITLIFIAWHVWETRIAAAFGAEVNFDMMADIVSNPFMLWFYIIGIVLQQFSTLQMDYGHSLLAGVLLYHQDHNKFLLT